MRAELVTLTASVLINTGILFSVDHAVVRLDQAQVIQHRREAANRAARQAADALNFEFVEAPPVAQPKRPVHTRRISDRDALNQDMTRDKTMAQGTPNIATVSTANQLRQERGKPSSAPSVAAPKIEPRPPQLQPQQQEEPKSPPKTADALKPSKEEKINEATLVTRPPEPARPASTPAPERPAVQGLGGPDRITTSEVSKSRSHGAQLYGVTSFEATGSGMGQYIKNMKERIWLAWFPYLMVHYPKDFKTADALVSFKLNAKGEVTIVQVVESKGSPLFSAFCMESVQRASPFGPLPQELLDLTGKDEVEIKFAFHYW